MLSVFESNLLQINIANKRHLPLDSFIERYACKVRDLLNMGIEDESEIDRLLDCEVAYVH